MPYNCRKMLKIALKHLKSLNIKNHRGQNLYCRVKYCKWKYFMNEMSSDLNTRWNILFPH